MHHKLLAYRAVELHDEYLDRCQSMNSLYRIVIKKVVYGGIGDYRLITMHWDSESGQSLSLLFLTEFFCLNKDG